MKSKAMSEMETAMKKYAETFGDGFPSYQLARSVSPEEIVELINECVKARKDVYEMGYLEDDLNDW